MRHRFFVLAAVLSAGVLGFAAPANASAVVAQPHPHHHHHHHMGQDGDNGASAMSVDPHDVTFRADLTGEKVLDDKGEAGAGGYVVVDLKPNNQMCYVIWTHDVDGQITAAHIHLGNNTKNGPVFVPLATPSFGSIDTCQQVTTRVAAALNNEPTNFYVNVHSTRYPDGAIRGQLHRG